MLPMLDQQSWIMGVGWNLGIVHGVRGLYKVTYFDFDNDCHT